MQAVTQHLRRYFVAGLVVIVPIWGTYLILKALFFTLDGLTAGLLRQYGLYYPGLGILVLLAVVFLGGFMATNIIGRQVVHLWERMLQRVPLVKGIYGLFKSVVDTFWAQGLDRFNRVVLVQVNTAAYALGFVVSETQKALREGKPERMVTVFVPTTPNPTSGFVLMVSEANLIPLNISIEEGMKMILSLGMYQPVATGPGGIKPSPVGQQEVRTD